jgi:hypothetical protein
MVKPSAFAMQLIPQTFGSLAPRVPLVRCPAAGRLLSVKCRTRARRGTRSVAASPSGLTRRHALDLPALWTSLPSPWSRTRDRRRGEIRRGGRTTPRRVGASGSRMDPVRQRTPGRIWSQSAIGDLRKGCVPFVQIARIRCLLKWVHGPCRLVRTEHQAAPATGAHRAEAALAQLLDCGVVIHGISRPAVHNGHVIVRATPPRACTRETYSLLSSSRFHASIRSTKSYRPVTVSASEIDPPKSWRQSAGRRPNFGDPRDQLQNSSVAYWSPAVPQASVTLPSWTWKTSTALSRNDFSSRWPDTV